MPLFSLDIQKQRGTEFWTNRYILQLADVVSGSTSAAALVEAERAITLSSVTFTSYRVSDQTPNTDVFSITPIGLVGLRTSGVGTEMPLFNVARVDFQVSMGRPSRKYIRGSLIEGDSESYGALIPAYLQLVNDNYVAGCLAVAAYVDVDGQSLISGACNANVGMRQLRRGSRRRTEPIIPVS
jgi:hypothetical protein